jgi:hypothetical protein
MIDLNKITRQFLLGEEKKTPSTMAYIQSLGEALGKLRPRTQQDRNITEVAKSHLREIKKQHRKLQERVSVLEEKLNVLEEMSSMAGGAVAFSPAKPQKRRKKKNDSK